jgi:hypothetical protein
MRLCYITVVELTYRIAPRGGTYRVELIRPGEAPRLVAIWPTEELAVSHLRQLERSAQQAARQANPGEKDWRG